MEVRWFYEGAIPGEVVEWFRSGERLTENEPPRVDRYMRLGEADGLGIKVREGRLEIKQRTGKGGVIRFQGRASGQIEEWRKWSFVLDTSNEALGGLLVPGSAWVSVEKTRELRRYSLIPGGQLETALAGQFPARGCNAELSRLVVEGQSWWSVCLEAFGGESLLQEALMLAAARIFDRPLATFNLQASDSFGYPRWLASLAPGRDSQPV
jgi:hypothetical protein